MKDKVIDGFKKENLISQMKQIVGGENKVFYVIDRKIMDIYNEEIFSTVKEDEYYIYDANENNKTMDYVFEIYDALFKGKYQRSDAIVAVGGGVTGDITGFVASTYMRGISLVHVPTTLLAMADSSIGSKTAINCSGIKNSIGSFYPAVCTLLDTSFLDTLSDDDFFDGVSEIIKISCVLDLKLFETLESFKSLSSLEKREKIKNIVPWARELKESLVVDDFLDHGARLSLNFGHTIGHGIEALAMENGENQRHGRAVSIGMCEITERAIKLGLAEASLLDRLVSLLSAYYLPNKAIFDNYKLYNAILNDKKREVGLNRLIICPEIGKYEILTLSDAELKDFING